MSSVEKENIFSDGEDRSTVTNYQFSVVLTTNDSYTNEETKRRISLSKPAMAILTKITKVLEVSSNTNVKLLQTTVFPAVLYGCKGKEIKDRLMILWRVRRINESVTHQIMPKHSLETLATISKLKYFGHIMHSSDLNALLLLLNHLTGFLNTGIYMLHIIQKKSNYHQHIEVSSFIA